MEITHSEGNSSFLNPDGLEFNFFTLILLKLTRNHFKCRYFYPVLHEGIECSIQVLGLIPHLPALPP